MIPHILIIVHPYCTLCLGILSHQVHVVMSLWCTAWPSHPLSEVKKTNVSSSIPASFKTDMIVPTASSNSFCGCEGHKTLQYSNEYVRVTIGNFKLVQIATIKLASKNRLWLKNWKWFKQLWRKCRLSTLTQAQLDLSYFLSPVTIPCLEKNHRNVQSCLQAVCHYIAE